MTTPPDVPAATPAPAAGSHAWLTPGRCRLILLLVLTLGFIGNVSFIRNCPFDLSGDEAHYWDWSRNLDLSYYSKGPLIAYIIRASCAIFGDTEAAVRYPAAVLAVGTSVVTYLLTRKLFDSERVALGAVLLNHIVPMYVAGSFLMTIDPPFFLCWALATYLAAIAIFRDHGGTAAWVGVGVAVGLGFLAKYAAMLWFVCVLPFMLTDDRARRLLRTRGPYLAMVITLLFTVPVLIWNAGHGWITFRHVATQTGAISSARFNLGNPFEMIVGQLGALGLGLAIIAIAASIYALGARGQADPHRRQMRFLAWIGISFLVLNLLASFRTKIQMNWPAPAYFTLLILSTGFLATRWNVPQRWRTWRWVLWPTVAFAIALMPVLHNPDLLYPAIPWVNTGADRIRAIAKEHPQNPVLAWAARRMGDGAFTARELDFSAKLRGWEELGTHAHGLLREMGEGAFLMSDNYQQTAQAAFYLPGQPRTYYAGSYFVRNRRRHAQYDLWRGLEQPALKGRNAIHLGFRDPALEAAFERIEPLPDLRIYRHGQFVRVFRLWKCINFKGFERRQGEQRY